MSIWYRCKGGVWCEFQKLDINHEYLKNLEGVYVIWTGMKDRKVLRVGSGNIRAQLLALKKDIAIQAFSHLGLYVTWAEVGSIRRAGVETYLFNNLKPSFMSYTPSAIPIKIVYPWDEEYES